MAKGMGTLLLGAEFELMSVSLSRWVLWGFLVLLLPLPVYHSGWFVLPAGRLSQLQLHAIPDLGLLAQALASLVFISLLVWGYGRWSLHWPARIRGSIVGLVTLTMLIVFSSVPIYLPYDQQPNARVEFRELYSLPDG